MTTPNDPPEPSLASAGSVGEVLARGIADIIRIATEPDWIPVTERLPEPWVVVIVCTDDDDEADVGCVDALKHWRNPHTGDMAVGSVTHWMPLPAPPTDGK
jgi:hypothetical protein